MQIKILQTLILTLLTFNLFGQSELQNQINNILHQEYESGINPGFTVGVVKDGKLMYQGQKGYANLEYDIPFSEKTIFSLASVTKQFTAACIGILETQGKLSVNDDVRKYIPELEFYGDTIKIKHLLNHTSGIRNHNILLDLMGFDYATRGYTNKMIEGLMFSQKGVNHKPNTRMLYSNTNYVLLVLIIKRVSGMEIQEFAQKELFEPLGMTNTFFKSDLEQIIKNRAYSYYKSEEGYKQAKNLSTCIGAGGLNSTISDLAKWSEIFLNPNHKFNKLASFLTKLDTLSNGQVMKYARGVFIAPYKNHQTIHHSGREIGMRSQFICVPDLNLALIIFTNSEHINAVDMSYKILDLLIDDNSKNSKTKRKQKVFNAKKKDLESYIGDYQELNSDLLMHIMLENDTLKAKSSFGRSAVPLKAKTEGIFTRIDNESVSYTFENTGFEDADMLVDFGGAIFYFEKVNLELSENINYKDFEGVYFSEELGVDYVIEVENNTLKLSYPQHENINLKPIKTDEFGSGRRTKYTFNRNQKGKVISFEVASEGTVKNILFEKLDLDFDF